MKSSYIHLTTYRLNRPIRITIMIFLILSFFIISPIIIFYIAGFRYDFSTHHIRQTGVLSIDIKPKDAHILLNDISIYKHIPIKLNNRAPGTYNVFIQKSGFKPWHKDITIESNQTTYVNDIILIREPVPQKTHTQFDNIIGIYGTQKSELPLIMMQHDNVYEIVKYNIEQDNTIPLIRTTSDDTPEISLSPYRNLAMIHVTKNTEDIIYLIPLDTSQSIATFNLKGVKYISWYDNWFEPLVIQIDKNIITLSPNKNKQIIHTTQSDDWYLDNNGILWTYTDNILTYMGSDEQYSIKQLDHIVHINSHRIVTSHADTLTIINRHSKEQQTLNAQHTYYNDTNKQLLAWNPWEVSVIYDDGSIRIINRSGDDIKNIHIFDEYNTLIFTTQNGIKTFDPRYYVGYDLIPDDIEFIFTNTKKRVLIYVNPRDNKLYKIDFSVQ